ncbi:hypothetical protein AAP_01230 [Ascosphaera apis ARSEF 7405]|uniref:Uncharacterized protein n=1 Tax=Ascosphaera apis ARSEF 7405 TaxID=392613 RepID=A0A168CDG4_9EURO|nr:hypothetical protein AAP_01230 [Ascosphaera apis ARSEF 7405]
MNLAVISRLGQVTGLFDLSRSMQLPPTAVIQGHAPDKPIRLPIVPANNTIAAITVTIRDGYPDVVLIFVVLIVVVVVVGSMRLSVDAKHLLT